MSDHLVARQVLEIAAPDATLARTLAERAAVAAPVLAEVLAHRLDTIGGGDRIRIDRLLLTLPPCDPATFEASLLANLDRALAEALPRELARADPCDAANDALELLETLAGTGVLPWWAIPAEPALTRAAAALAVDRRETTAIRLRTLFHTPGGTARLAAQLATPMLATIAARLTAIPADALAATAGLFASGRGVDIPVIWNAILIAAATLSPPATLDELGQAMLAAGGLADGGAGFTPPPPASRPQQADAPAPSASTATSPSMAPPGPTMPVPGRPAISNDPFTATPPSQRPEVLPPAPIPATSTGATPWPSIAVVAGNPLPTGPSSPTSTPGSPNPHPGTRPDTDASIAVARANATGPQPDTPPTGVAAARPMEADPAAPTHRATRVFPLPARDPSAIAAQASRADGPGPPAASASSPPASQGMPDHHRPPADATRPAIAKRPRGLSDLAHDSLALETAGLPLLWPFMPSYLRAAGLLDAERRFVSDAAQHRAAALIDHLATGDRAPPEYRLPVPKLLAGLPLGAVHIPGPPLTDAEAQEADALLDAVLGHLTFLGKLGAAGFRDAWLHRSGILAAEPGAFVVRVERHAWDVLLDRLPWPLGWIRLPWMPDAIRVEW